MRGQVAADMRGQRFGRLTVIERRPSHQDKAMWLCACDCGELGVAQGQRLRKGKTRSCGCLQREGSSAEAQDARRNQAR